MEPRLHIAVQHRSRLQRDTLTAYLDRHPDFVAVGAASGHEELLQLCFLRRPDAVILEAHAREWDVTRLIARLRALHPAVRVMGLYEPAEPDDGRAVPVAAVDTLIRHSSGLAGILGALRELRDTPAAGSVSRGRGTLTVRELEVLRLIGIGCTAREAARALGISIHTVENHKRRLFDKLGARSRVDLAASAARLGLLPADVDPPSEQRRLTPVRRAVVLLRGRPGVALRTVRRLLADNKVAVVDDLPGADRGAARPGGGVPDAVAVLVDPSGQDWHELGLVALPIVVVATAAVTYSSVVDAVLRGAAALIPGEQIATRLVTAIQLAREGYLLLDATVVRRFLEGAAPGGSLGASRGAVALTRRERDILALIGKGLSVRQSARALGISARTVENLQSSLFRKLGVHSRGAAYAAARRLGLITGEEMVG